MEQRDCVLERMGVRQLVRARLTAVIGIPDPVLARPFTKNKKTMWLLTDSVLFRL